MTTPTRRPATRHAAAMLAGWGLIGGMVTGIGQTTRWVDSERSTVTVYVSAPGNADDLGTAHILEIPIAEGSVEDTEMPHLAVVVNLDQMHVVDPGRSARDRQATRDRILGREGLDAARFSRITYHSLTIDRRERDTWVIHGELEIRGRFLPLTVRARREGDRFTGTTTLAPSDVGTQPNRPGSPPDGSREIRVDFDVVLAASSF